MNQVQWHGTLTELGSMAMLGGPMDVRAGPWSSVRTAGVSLYFGSSMEEGKDKESKYSEIFGIFLGQ